MAHRLRCRGRFSCSLPPLPATAACRLCPSPLLLAPAGCPAAARGTGRPRAQQRRRPLARCGNARQRQQQQPAPQRRRAALWRRRRQRRPAAVLRGAADAARVAGGGAARPGHRLVSRGRRAEQPSVVARRWLRSGCDAPARARVATLPRRPAPTLRRYVLPRPEGQRCLVVAARGTTVARLRNGVLLERFASPLPGGGQAQQGGGEDNFCILDCVYHATDETYYILGGWAGARGCCLGRGNRRRARGRSPGLARRRTLAPPPRRLQTSCAGKATACTTAQPSSACSGCRASWRRAAPRRPLPPRRRAAAAPARSTPCRLMRGPRRAASCRCPRTAARQRGWPARTAVGSGARPAAGAGFGPASPPPRSWPAPLPRLLPPSLYTLPPARRHSFVQDGVLMLHKEAQYSPGQTPLALLWKDAGCSRYVIDTDAAGAIRGGPSTRGCMGCSGAA